MGDKRPSVRTLPTGEKVVHLPGGEVYLVPSDRVAGALEGQSAETERGVGDAAARLSETIEAKRVSLSAGDQVPGDKRPV